ncbi:glycerophosphocholine phosphodiesterase GPCPD1-like [Bactrocera neohumeralis]|uniref:glycerophosphocholine phosphodiesterase GPCPD1-like n=1 Tax=Bactrocera neohumeralis TaxID=98809 RepID=UPI002164FDE4|nr:glycerophosphocholine phosphodiesterase GPCPD1-like [Bactrocera neohumeralis]
MFSLAKLCALCAVLSIFAGLPRAAQCDSSYYEKYYTARRFIPLKRNSLIPYNFSVSLNEQPLASYELVAMVGDVKQLGAWRADKAILLNRTQDHRVWTASVALPVNTTINYRYFIAAIDNATGVVQVRRWESHINARSFQVGTVAGNRSDACGWIDPQRRELQRGWLNAGNIVQFKLFRNPLHVNETSAGNEELRFKLQPVEPCRLSAILPSAKAHTEYVRMVYGDSYLRTQPEFGVPYKPNDILIFQTTVSQLDNVAYLLKLYTTQNDNELVRLIGYQYIYPEFLKGTEGRFTINLLSPVWLNAIGSLDIQYLVIKPLPNSTVDFHTSFVEYWRSNWTALDVGHRGLGKSLKQATNAPAIIENTVASMKASTELGADLVEFDVMLTSDLVPVIYHDYYIYVCMDPKTPTSKADLTEVLIKDITYEQLKNLKTYQVVGNKIIEYPAHNNVEQEDQRLFPLFEDFLTKVNKSVGFNIEIKWPQLILNGELESVQTIDKNTYVDRILDVMLRHGCGRLSFFSSFDADICTLLRYKQNIYPIMFLSSTILGVYADPRADTLYDTINNAQAFDLAGIVPNAVHIKNDPKWIEIAAKQGKKVFLWGDELKNTETIEWFKAQAPTGVIYDRVDLWLPANKRSAFELEADLPDFFRLQCSPNQQKPVNSTIESILSNVNLL